MNNKLISGIMFSVAVATILVLLGTKTTSNISNDTVTLTSNNTLTLSDEVNGYSVGQVIHQSKKIKPSRLGGSKEPMYLFLNTPGGEIQAGLELIEALKGLDRPVNTVTLFAASMGFQIAQNMNERLILKNGTLMSHRARGRVEGEFGGQNPSQLQSRINFHRSRIDEMDQQTVNRTNGRQTMETYQAQYANELWMSGVQAVERGYADRVVTVKCDNSLNGVTSHSTSFMGMTTEYDLDNCPLNTSPSNIRMKLETTHGVMWTDEFIKNGGIFGVSGVLTQDPNRIYALDTTLTAAKVEDIRHDFISKYNNNLRNVVYMTVGN